jgi:hypothetical protein
VSWGVSEGAGKGESRMFNQSVDSARVDVEFPTGPGLAQAERSIAAIIIEVRTKINLFVISSFFRLTKEAASLFSLDLSSLRFSPPW